MSLLYNYLEKKGIKSRESLTPDEKATFEKWEQVLNREIKEEDILSLISKTIEDLQKKWLELEDKNALTFIFYWKEQLYLKARIKNLILLRELFKSNKNNKLSVENYLKDLLKK